MHKKLITSLEGVRKIVITGPIGSGKSTLANEIANETPNCEVLNYDLLSHHVLENDYDVRKQEMEIFGTTDRERLATIIFNDKEKKLMQHSIILPAVYKYAISLSEKLLSTNKIVVHEIPVLAESKEYWPKEFTTPSSYFDIGILLDITEDEAVKRVSSKLAESDIRARFHSQCSRSKRIEALNYVSKKLVEL